MHNACLPVLSFSLSMVHNYFHATFFMFIMLIGMRWYRERNNMPFFFSSLLSPERPFFRVFLPLFSRCFY